MINIVDSEKLLKLIDDKCTAEGVSSEFKDNATLIEVKILRLADEINEICSMRTAIELAPGNGIYIDDKAVSVLKVIPTKDIKEFSNYERIYDLNPKDKNKFDEELMDLDANDVFVFYDPNELYCKFLVAANTDKFELF